MRTIFVVCLLAVGLSSALAAPGQALIKTIKSHQTRLPQTLPIKTFSGVSSAEEDYKGLIDAIEKAKIDISQELDNFATKIETILSGIDEGITGARKIISTSRKLAIKSFEEAVAGIPGSSLNDVYLAVFFGGWELRTIYFKGTGDLEILFQDVAEHLLGKLYRSVDIFEDTVEVLAKPVQDQMAILFPDRS